MSFSTIRWLSSIIFLALVVAGTWKLQSVPFQYHEVGPNIETQGSNSQEFSRVDATKQTDPTKPFNKVFQETRVSENESFSNDPTFDDKTTTQLIHRHGAKEYYCLLIRHTESNCRLYVHDGKYGSDKFTGEVIQAGNYTKLIQPSPNGLRLAIFKERSVLIIDVPSEHMVEIATTPIEFENGIYSGFPAFMPDGNWIDDDHVRVGVYKSGTMEVSDGLSAPQPLFEKIIPVASNTT